MFIFIFYILSSCFQVGDPREGIYPWSTEGRGAPPPPPAHTHTHHTTPHPVSEGYPIAPLSRLPGAGGRRPRSSRPVEAGLEPRLWPLTPASLPPPPGRHDVNVPDSGKLTFHRRHPPKGPNKVTSYPSLRVSLCHIYAPNWFGLVLVYWGLMPQQQPTATTTATAMMMKSVFWWRKPEYPEETTGLRQVTDGTFHT